MRIGSFGLYRSDRIIRIASFGSHHSDRIIRIASYPGVSLRSTPGYRALQPYRLVRNRSRFSHLQRMRHRQAVRSAWLGSANVHDAGVRTPLGVRGTVAQMGTMRGMRTPLGVRGTVAPNEHDAGNAHAVRCAGNISTIDMPDFVHQCVIDGNFR